MLAFSESRRRTRLICLELCLLAPLLVGCQGCRDETLGEQKQEQRPAVEVSHQAVRSAPEDPAAVGIPVKPGHWMAMGQSWKANAADYRGLLRTTPRWLGEPADANSAKWPMHSLRPAVLPKGQTKRLESRVLIPPSFTSDSRRLAIETRFEARGQGVLTEGGSEPAQIMAPDEYFFVVLTERPEEFSSLQVHDWVRPPFDPQTSSRPTVDYRVVIPTGDGMLPVPDTFFEWTSTAYLLWDDVVPETLTADQRRAIRDWVNWGGQIILNGPQAARALTGSEFADLLPVEFSGSEGLDAERLVGMLRRWSVPSDGSLGRLAARLEQEGNASRAGVSGVVRGGAVELPETAGLVLEQRRGRGRVAMTRFDLTAGWLADWSSLQSFYNAALLRRPPRIYQAAGKSLRLGFAGVDGERPDDPRLATRVRIFARDAALPIVEPVAAAEPDADEPAAAAPAEVAMPSPWLDTDVAFAPALGMGAWSDRSDTALAATGLLRDQAGITIPKSTFVAKSLAIYLIVLVPLNWLIFAMIGRLEWAWVTVPVIGIVGAAMIARSAQLDIGFARSRTEIGLLEAQGGYPRGHLSRYLAVYNSLSTRYEFRFEGREAVAAPMGMARDSDPGDEFGFHQSFDQGVSLTGVTIASNQTKGVHAEQMIDLGGAIEFSAERGFIDNASGLTLWDAAIISRGADGELRNAAFGVLEAGESAAVRLRSGPPQFADELPMGVEELLRRLTRGDDLQAGETRLVARCEAPQPGLAIAPEVLQTRHQTIVMVHLTRPPLPPPENDRNLRADIPVDTEEHD